MKKRIAYVCLDSGVPVFGNKGSSVHVQEVLHGFLRAGYAVELFATRLGGECPMALQGVRIHRLRKAKTFNLAEKEIALFELNKMLERELHLAGPFDFVYERHALWAFAAMEFAKENGIPGLLEINAPLVEEQEKWRGLVDRTKAERTVRCAVEAAAHLLCVSKELANQIAAQYAAAASPHVIANGVNPNKFKLIQSGERTSTNKTGPITIGFVGTLKPWHGLEFLLDAAEELLSKNLDIRLLIVGDGPQREELETRLAGGNSNLKERTEFAGAVAPKQIPGFLQQMDIAVAPYPVLENFYFSPLKIYEYMVTGLPVVASRTGQIKQVIQDGINGLLSEPGNAHDLAANLATLIEDEPLRKRLGTAARLTILKNHTWDRQVQRILEIAQIKTQPISQTA